MWSAAAVRLLAAGLVSGAACTAPARTYHGYRVYDVAVSGEAQAAQLRLLARRAGSQLWSEECTTGPLQLQVAPAAAAAVEAALNASTLPYRLRIEDLQRLIDDEEADVERRSRIDHDVGDRGFDLGAYHRLDEIEAFLRTLPERHPSHARLEVIGRTHERRPILLLRLRQNASAPADRPVMWVDCGIHAREWVSPATCLFVISQLLGPERGWLAHYDWHLVPVVNPDGYVYTHTHDRLWRKNRRPGHYCTGVDLNRNFAARWGTYGVTFLECGMTFPGYRPFSERESRAVRDAVLRDRVRIAAFNSVHSYGQMWLVPYGYSWLASPDVRRHRHIGRRATRAMRAVSGVRYRYGISSRVLYLDSGTSTDWAYRSGVPHSVAIEARDRGYYGFLLPPRLILPTAREVWAGLRTQAQMLARDVT